jgi:hypothetical protein
VPYWPERHLRALNPNHLVVGVGGVSSDHDRACEAFYQLYGGRVDYGDEHSTHAGHDRYGELVPRDQALHPDWSEDNPVHLLGHSFGSTTAIELYQLLCVDFFGVGSSHRWVRSIVSIAGPLAGSALPHAFGLHASPPEGEMRALSLGHALGSSLGLWFRLHNSSRVVRGLFPFRMPQWEARASGPMSDLVSPHGPINGSKDLAVYNLLPKERMERNARLQDMDKVFLISVASSDVVESAQGCAADIPLSPVMLFIAAIVASMVGLVNLVPALMVAVYACRRWLLLFPTWLLLQRCVCSLHDIFPGFDRDEWSANDGVVNIYSTLKPWTAHWADATPSNGMKASSSVASSLSTAASDELESLSDWSSSSPSASPRAAVGLPLEDADSDPESDDSGEVPTSSVDPEDGFFSLDDEDALSACQRGKWHVHRVATHHMAGTYFDREAPELMLTLLSVMARRFERD